MIGIPPIKQWKSYAQLGVMKLQGKEVICHGVGERCKRSKIKAIDILEGSTQLLSQQIDIPQNLEYKDEVFEIKTEHKDLSIKEAAQLIWHGFRLSSGYPQLQFTMMHQALEKFGSQNISVDEVWKAFCKTLKIGETHSTTTVTEWKEPNWRPPHPKINRFVNTVEHGTDIALSDVKSHATITSEMIADGIEAVKMLLEGEGGITSKDDYHEKRYSTKNKKLELKGECIDVFLQLDHSYIIGKDGVSSRPNRNSQHDGKNTIKDRFFSYLVWFIIKNNPTGNTFFDEYFNQLHSFFPKWFSGLPTDDELKTQNEKQTEERGWGYDTNPRRKKLGYGYSDATTKEDVFMLIARYNATHPDTQINISELGIQ